MWLTGRLVPDFKTIADFRRDNGAGIRNVCRRFVAILFLKLAAEAAVHINGYRSVSCAMRLPSDPQVRPARRCAGETA
jgi:transposase